MKFGFFDILELFTVFQFFFFGLFLFSQKKGNAPANRLLAVFLFSKALCFLNDFFWDFYEIVVQWTPHVFMVGRSFEFLLGPALYFYLKSLAYRDFKFRALHLLHLLPFVAHFTFMAYKFHFRSYAFKYAIVMDPDIVFLTKTQSVLNNAAIYIHFLTYSIAALFLLRFYRQELKNMYSAIESKKLAWFGVLLSGFVGIWGLALLDYISYLFKAPEYVPDSFYLIAVFIFANLIAYKGWKQPELFGGVQAKDRLAESKTRVSNGEQYLEKIKAFMEKEKPYLNPDLTVNELAEQLSMPVRTFSQVLNNHLKQNFFDFINSYRIKESQDLLIHVDGQAKTILDVLYDVGFNSKSAFNTAFRKHTGMTPTEFKNLQTHYTQSAPGRLSA